MGVLNLFRALITMAFYRTPLEVDQTAILDDKPGFNNVLPLIVSTDSYSVGDRCYCHILIGFEGAGTMIETPHGSMAARDVCKLIGPGPGSIGRPMYNDIQCGNGPQIGLGDEKYCPGRVDRGRAGCGVIGPKWNWDGVVLP